MITSCQRPCLLDCKQRLCCGVEDGLSVFLLPVKCNDDVDCCETQEERPGLGLMVHPPPPRQVDARPRLTTLSCCVEFLCPFPSSSIPPSVPGSSPVDPPTPLIIYMPILLMIDTLEQLMLLPRRKTFPQGWNHSSEKEEDVD